MILAPRFTDDVSELPTAKFGPSSLTWWGIIGFMVIEGAGFVLDLRRLLLPDGARAGLAARGAPAAGPPRRHAVHDRHPLSEVPNTTSRGRRAPRDVPTIRLLMPVMVGIGVVLLVLRGFEFNSLNCRWTDNAYGSIVWAVLLLHATHLLTDWGDTVVLTALMYTPVAYEERRLIDVDENCALLALRLAAVDSGLSADLLGAAAVRTRAHPGSLHALGRACLGNDRLFPRAPDRRRLRPFKTVVRCPSWSSSQSLLGLLVIGAWRTRLMAGVRRDERGAGPPFHRGHRPSGLRTLRLGVLLPFIASMIIPRCWE